MAAFTKSWQREFCVTPEVDQSAGLTQSVAKTDLAMEAWYHPPIALMTPNPRVTWQATSNDENS